MEKKYYFRGLGLGIIVTALIMGIALSGGEKRELTDDEVIARAKELGMTETNTLLEPPETDESQDENETAAEKESPKEPVKKDVAVAKPKDDTKEAPKGDAEEPSEEQSADGAGSEAQKKTTVQTETASNAAAENQKPGSDTNGTAQNKKPGSDTNEMTKQDEDPGQKSPSEAESSRQTAAEASIVIESGDSSYTVAKKLEDAGVIVSASSYDDFLCQNGYDKRLRTGTFRIPEGAGDEQIARIVTSQPKE